MGTKEAPSISRPLTSGEISAEPFIGKNEVARRMKRTVRQVEKMMSDRLIPFYKFDAHAAFRWSEIQAAFAEMYRVPVLAHGTTQTNQTEKQHDR